MNEGAAASLPVWGSPTPKLEQADVDACPHLGKSRKMLFTSIRHPNFLRTVERTEHLGRWLAN
jgi:hypothetical protein